MQDIIKTQRTSRNCLNISKQEMSKNSQNRGNSQDRALTQLNTEHFEENKAELEKEQIFRGIQSKNHSNQASRLQKLQIKEKITSGVNFIRKHGSDNDVKLSSDSTKKLLEPQLTEAQKEEVAARNQRNALKRVTRLRGLAGKMYVSEFWSKKQRIEMSNVSPSIAEKIQSPNLISNRKLALGNESPLVFQRKFKRKIANDLFEKYQNGVPISDKDIIVDLPLYEQAIQSGMQSPSSRYLESQYLSLPPKTGPVSMRELRKNSNLRDSPEEPSNLLKLTSYETHFASMNSLPNINQSPLLKNVSVCHTEISKEQVTQSQKLSYRNSLFDLNASSADLKEISGRQSALIVDLEKKGSSIKPQISVRNKNQSGLKMSDKLKKLILPDKVVQKDHNKKRGKNEKSKFTLNIRSPTHNALCGNSLNDDSETLTKGKTTLRITSRTNKLDSEHSVQDIGSSQEEGIIKPSISKIRKDPTHKILTTRQKENVKQS